MNITVPREGQITIRRMPEFEKALTPEEFQSKYPKDKFEQYTPQNLSKYIKDISKSINNEQDANEAIGIVKGTFNTFQEVKVCNPLGLQHIYYVRLKQEKKEIEKAKEGDVIEKALDSFSYGDNSVKFDKTGKEIKQQISLLQELKETQIADSKVKMKELAEEIGVAPTEDLDNWQKRGLELLTMGMKQYKCNYNGLCKEGEEPTPEDKKMKYNRALSCYLDCLKELKQLKAYYNAFEDKKNYKLNSQQIMDLNF